MTESKKATRKSKKVVGLGGSPAQRSVDTARWFISHLGPLDCV